MIELYIENQQVDLDTDSSIVLNKQLNDILDPSKIKNDFSRTASLPSTHNNNQIFANIFELSKFVAGINLPNVGKNFNPSQKATFTLYFNSIRLSSGYIKLNNISYQNEFTWRYEITMFGELGQFFANFANVRLDEFLDDTPYANSKLKINPENVYKLFTAIDDGKDRDDDPNLYSEANLTTNVVPEDFGEQTRNIYLDWIEAENGHYHSGDKFQFYYGYNEDNENNITNFSSSFTETQALVRKDTQQRFGFYNDILIKTLINKAGYELEESDFVSTDNPYWNKTLTTGRILERTMDDEETLTFAYTNLHIDFAQLFESQRYTLTWANNLSDARFTNQSIGPLPGYTPASNSLQFWNGHSIKFEDVLDQGLIEKYIVPKTIPRNFMELRIKGTNAKLPGGIYKASDPTRQILTMSFYDEIANFHNLLWLHGDESVEQGTITKYEFLYISDEVDPNQDGFTVKIGENWFNLGEVLSSFSYNRRILTKDIEDKRTAFALEVRKNDASNVFIEQVTNSSINFPVGDLQLHFNYSNIYDAQFELTNELVTGTRIKYSDLLPNVDALDYLISFIKLFGLYVDIDPIEKKVKLLTRNEFYTGNSIDWTEKFDEGRDSKQVPLNFKDRFIKLNYQESDLRLNELYREKYKTEYGSIRLNTAYDFNNNEYELFEDTIFEPTINSRVIRDMIGTNNRAKFIPQLYEDDLIDSSVSNPICLVFKNNYKILDPSPKLRGNPDNYWTLITGNTNDEIANEEEVHNFIQFQGATSTFTRYIIGPQEQGFGWLTEPIPTIGLTEPKYLQFSAYYPNELDINYSLDIFKPREIFFNADYPDGKTIYDRFWKDYLFDRYNVNTKIFTGYFYLTPADIHSINFRDFIWFKDKYWVINKVYDYNPDSTKPTKVELVSVNKLENYANSIKLD